MEEWLKGQPPRVLPSLSSLPDIGQDIGTFTNFLGSEDSSRTFFEQGPRTDASPDSPALYSSLGFKAKPLLEMTVEDVCALFHHCKFPTSGVLQGSVDGTCKGLRHAAHSPRNQALGVLDSIEHALHTRQELTLWLQNVVG